MMPQWTEDFVTVDDRQIHYIRTGQGDKPALILLHGFSDNGLCWLTLARDLQDQFDVILPDAQGHGLSARLQSSEQVDSVADVAGLITALGLQKPVVAFMSSVAASGGYWIASVADKIWASPTTITGSIGIYSAFPTLDKSLDYLGIHNDGVGTTRLSDAFNTARPLNPILADLIEQTIQNSYARFIKKVSEGRNMAPQEVEKIAQGRVWAGITAKELGLVDGIGNLQDAVGSAAELANLKDYEVVYVRQPLTAREEMIRRLNRFLAGVFNDLWGSSISPAVRMYEKLGAEFGQVMELNDPNGVYAYCLTCDVR